MRKRIFWLFALFVGLSVSGIQQARADVADANKVEGWTRLTELPAAADWGNYYFVIADYAQDLMLQLGRGVSQSSDQTKSTMWYQKSVSPYTDQSVMYTMELSHSENYDYQVLRPVVDNEYVLSCKSGSSYTYRTGMEKSVTAVAHINILPVKDGDTFKYFTIGNGNVDKSVYLGPWAETKNADELAAGTEVAINKSGNYIGHYIIYAILKTDYAAEQAARFERATAENPQDVSWLIKDRGFEQTTTFIAKYWTDETSNVSYGGVKANLNNNWIARYFNVKGKMSQTITGLKEGMYKVKCSGFYREGSLSNNLTLYQNGTEHGYGVIYANDAKAPLKSIYAGAKAAADADHGFSTQSGSYYVPDGTGNLAKAIATGIYDDNEVEVAVTSGTLTFGVMNTTAVASDYLPMDNFELWYCGPITAAIHELGTMSVNLASKNYLTKEIPSTFQLSYPSFVSSDTETITLVNASGITVDGASTSATYTDGALSFSIPNTVGSHTIVIPTGTIGFATSKVYNEEISINYTVIEPVLPEAISGYLYTMVSGEKKFLSRGNTSSTRAILADYAVPVQLEASDGSNLTRIKCLDSKLYMFAYNGEVIYTDTSDPANKTTYEINKVGEGQYKLRAVNSTGWVGPKNSSEYWKIYNSKSEADAFVWQMMTAADYDQYVAECKVAIRNAALTAAGSTEAELETCSKVVVKDATATETATRAENYVDGNTKDDGSRAFTKTWEYTGLDNGLYVVSIKGFNRNGTSANVFGNYQYDKHLTFFEVNGTQQLLMSALDGKSAEDYCSSSTGDRYHDYGTIGGSHYYIPLSMNGADVWFDNGKYNNEMLVNVTDGKLTVKVTRDSYVEQCWTIWRDLTISRYIMGLDDAKDMAIKEINAYEGDATFEAVAADAITAINAATSEAAINAELNKVRDAYTAYQYGITDWSNTTLTTNIENDVIKAFLEQAQYEHLGAKPILSETPAQSDYPRTITIPVKRADQNVTVSITETKDNYTGCFTTTASAAAGNIDCQYNAVPGHTYYYKVENAGNEVLTQGSVTIEGTVRYIYAEGGSNMRDLGGRITTDGKKVKYGRLFRGGEMHAGYQTTLTAAGIAEMQRLGIVAELDLRQDGEVNGNTASAIPGADYLYVNLVPSGTEIIYDEPGIYQEKIKNGIHFIAESLKKGNVYYHCIWGADRTGAMSMFLECILGCQLSDIEKDYQLTSFSKAGLRPNSTFNLDGKLTAINDLGFAGNTIQEKVVSFLKSIGVTDDDITTIRTQLLEENNDAMTSYVATLNAAYGKVATAAGATYTTGATIAAAQTNINTAMAALSEVKDITAVLHNPGFEENGGSLDNWATRGNGCGKGGSSNHVGRIFDTTGSVRQVLQNMPAGTYTLKAQSFARKASGANEANKGEGYQKYMSGELKSTAYMMLNDQKTMIRNIYEDALDTEIASGYNPTLGVYVPENTTSGSAVLSSAIDGGRLYWNVATVTLSEPGDLCIGFANDENIAGDYTVFDNCKLYYEPASVELPTITLDQTAAPVLPAIDGAYKVTSNRVLTAGKWNTLCLPFDLTAEDIAATPITEVRRLNECTIEGDHASMNFAEVNEIKAGKPYIVKVSEAWTVASEKAIVRAKTPVKTTIAEGITIVGNYAPTTLNGQYYISGDKFYYANVDVAMKGYRASITLPEGSSVKALDIDTTDAIESIENEQNTETAIYDLSGRRISQPNYRGIYIRGGKKVVVK